MMFSIYYSWRKLRAFVMPTFMVYGFMKAAPGMKTESGYI